MLGSSSQDLLESYKLHEVMIQNQEKGVTETATVSRKDKLHKSKTNKIIPEYVIFISYLGQGKYLTQRSLEQADILMVFIL